MWSWEVNSDMRKANIFLHELFTFQFSEATAIVLLAGQGSGQQTGLTSYFFFHEPFFLSVHFLYTECFIRLFYDTVEVTLL